MSIYDLPKFKKPNIKGLLKKGKEKKKLLPRRKKEGKRSSLRQKISWIVLIIVFSSLFGFLAGGGSSLYFYKRLSKTLDELGIPVFPERIVEKEKVIEKEYIPESVREEAIINTVENVFPSVVSVIVTKDVPVYERVYDPFGSPEYKQKGTEEQEVGGGTGFIVSEAGLLLTNKHVVSDTEANYTVLTNQEEEYEAQVLARDPIQDLAVLEIKTDKKLKPVKLGDSSGLEIGQTVIAIGNALGEFRNTVSVGVVSGLARTITATGPGLVETLRDVIQTDAAINRGNSGGPLLNLKGEVIGVNTAMSQTAENIGFAIPINKAKRDIEQVKETGKIVYPFLGIRYILINKEIQEKNDLSFDYGAWVVSGEEAGQHAVVPDSAADKAGIKEGDIILEFNGEKITTKNTLAEIIMNYNPGDKVTLKIIRDGVEKNIQTILGERSE